jgi:hypothetical protein
MTIMMTPVISMMNMQAYNQNMIKLMIQINNSLSPDNCINKKNTTFVGNINLDDQTSQLCIDAVQTNVRLNDKWLQFVIFFVFLESDSDMRVASSSLTWYIV